VYRSLLPGRISPSTVALELLCSTSCCVWACSGQPHDLRMSVGLSTIKPWDSRYLANVHIPEDQLWGVPCQELGCCHAHSLLLMDTPPCIEHTTSSQHRCCSITR
jgi:hypothetical protein